MLYFQPKTNTGRQASKSTPSAAETDAKKRLAEAN
jgi:hypothetical protein